MSSINTEPIILSSEALASSTFVIQKHPKADEEDFHGPPVRVMYQKDDDATELEWYFVMKEKQARYTLNKETNKMSLSISVSEEEAKYIQTFESKIHNHLIEQLEDVDDTDHSAVKSQGNIFRFNTKIRNVDGETGTKIYVSNTEQLMSEADDFDPLTHPGLNELANFPIVNVLISPNAIYITDGKPYISYLCKQIRVIRNNKEKFPVVNYRNPLLLSTNCAKIIGANAFDVDNVLFGRTNSIGMQKIKDVLYLSETGFYQKLLMKVPACYTFGAELNKNKPESNQRQMRLSFKSKESEAHEELEEMLMALQLKLDELMSEEYYKETNKKLKKVGQGKYSHPELCGSQFPFMDCGKKKIGEGKRAKYERNLEYLNIRVNVPTDHESGDLTVPIFDKDGEVVDGNMILNTFGERNDYITGKRIDVVVEPYVWLSAYGYGMKLRTKHIVVGSGGSSSGTKSTSLNLTSLSKSLFVDDVQEAKPQVCSDEHDDEEDVIVVEE